MKNNKNLAWSSRAGQIVPIVLYAVVIIIGAVAVVGVSRFTKKIEKPAATPTATTECVQGNDVNDIDCSRANAQKKLAEETQAELATERAVNALNDDTATCDAGGDPNVYLNCLNNAARLEKETPEQAKLREEINAVAAGSESSQWAAVDWAKSIWDRVSNFFVSPPERTMIELESLPAAKTCTPATSCINFCKYGGDLQNCRTTNADCTVTLSTKGTSCLPAPKTSGGGGGGGTTETKKPSGGTSAPTPAKACVPYDPYDSENLEANLVKVKLECGSWNPYENKGSIMSTKAQYDACVSNYWDSATVECP